MMQIQKPVSYFCLASILSNYMCVKTFILPKVRSSTLKKCPILDH